MKTILTKAISQSDWQWIVHRQFLGFAATVAVVINLAVLVNLVVAVSLAVVGILGIVGR